MSPSGGYPLHRPELYEPLRRGDALLFHAMAPQERMFRRHDRIIEAGEANDKVWRLRTGWLCRTRSLSDERRQIISIFLPGDLFAVKSLLLALQPDAIDCLTDVTANWIDHARLRDLVARESDVALRIMFQITEDERRLHNWATALGQGDAAERIAAMLLELRGRLHRLGLSSGNSFRLPLTQQDIGDFAGLTVVHVNRVLRRFREDGLATVRSGIAVIHDPSALADIARPVQDAFERNTIEFGGEPFDGT